MAKSKLQIWQIGHEDLPDAYVEAETFEEATYAAAKNWWKLPWRKVAAGCYVKRKLPILRNVCVVCGRVFNGTERMCTPCAVKEEEKLRRAKENSRRFYAEMMPAGANLASLSDEGALGTVNTGGFRRSEE
jgi:hypothetical protein